jgi:hypothetical protein
MSPSQLVKESDDATMSKKQKSITVYRVPVREYKDSIIPALVHKFASLYTSYYQLKENYVFVIHSKLTELKGSLPIELRQRVLSSQREILYFITNQIHDIISNYAKIVPYSPLSTSMKNFNDIIVSSICVYTNYYCLLILF